jgi:hypothetical protein
VFALWMARHYLRDIWLEVVSRYLRGPVSGGDAPGEGLAGPHGKARTDAAEPMAYPVALWVLVGGAVFLAIFAHGLGMWPWLALLFFGIYFAISLAVTRVRAELGPPAHDLHRGGPDLILTNLFGTDHAVFDPRQLTAMKLCFWFNRAYRSHPMPVQLEGFKIAQMAGIRQSSMAWALTLATFVGIFSAWWAQVHLFYVYGISAKTSFATTTFGREPFQELAGWLQAPYATRWPQVGAYGVGFLFTLLLMFLRVNFIWWPFHPVGYAISSSWSMNCLWLPIFIAWLVKTVILRYFGFKAFEQAIPFALGLVLGEFLVGSLWTIIGIVLQINTYSFWV